MSYTTRHSINNRATPSLMMLCEHSILPYKTLNEQEQQPPKEWIELNFTQILSSRQTHFECFNNALFKVGNNILRNRFSPLNWKIPLTWLNFKPMSFKVHCKNQFLCWQMPNWNCIIIAQLHVIEQITSLLSYSLCHYHDTLYIMFYWNFMIFQNMPELTLNDQSNILKWKLIICNLHTSQVLPWEPTSCM
jgi:hypothetical protein